MLPAVGKLGGLGERHGHHTRLEGSFAQRSSARHRDCGDVPTCDTQPAFLRLCTSRALSRGHFSVGGVPAVTREEPSNRLASTQQGRPR